MSSAWTRSTAAGISRLGRSTRVAVTVTEASWACAVRDSENAVPRTSRLMAVSLQSCQVVRQRADVGIRNPVQHGAHLRVRPGRRLVAKSEHDRDQVLLA